jgi:hypothetical protein
MGHLPSATIEQWTVRASNLGGREVTRGYPKNGTFYWTKLIPQKLGNERREDKTLALTLQSAEQQGWKGIRVSKAPIVALRRGGTALNHPCSLMKDSGAVE